MPEGESLGTAIDYLNNKVPYKDTIFPHGAFQDPLRSVLAFKIFGHSIAALRTVDSILTIITLLLFSTFLYLLFEKNIYYFAFSLFLLLFFWIARPVCIGFNIENRDIPLYLFLICAVLLGNTLKDSTLNINTNTLKRNIKTHSLLVFSSFISVLSFAYSVDRGFYIITASIIILGISYLFYLRPINPKFLISILSGYVLGFIGLGFAIKWAYYDFLKFTFLIMPKYKELMDGFVYPFNNIVFLIPVFIFALNLRWLTEQFINRLNSNEITFLARIKLFYKDYFMEIILFILAVFCFRSSLGRADVVHLLYTLAPLYILTIYIVTKHYLLRVLDNSKFHNKIIASLAILCLCVFSFYYVPHINLNQWYKFPIGRTDREFLSKSYIETSDFLKKNLKKNEDFYALTSEASWYYLINKPCPSQFPIVWFAMPDFYQYKIIKDLNKKNVKFVLYRNKYWANAIDGFSNEKRLPILFAYIKQNYMPYKKIYDNEIWIKR